MAGAAGPRRGALLLALSLLLALPAAAAPPLPLLQWRSFSTDWCDVHFHVEAEDEARRVAAVCDEAVWLSAALLDNTPLEKTQVVVADSEDRANGFTRTVPYNLVILYTIAPDGSSPLVHTDDHLRLVLLHEMLHVVHLETFSGLSRIANAIFGKFWPPNLIQPRWVVEGIAVYLESRATDGGRLRTDRFWGSLRVAALERDLWALDDLSNYSRRVPGGNAAYLYGGHFIAWLIAREGPDVIARVAHEYGSHPIPYAVQRGFRRAADLDITALYEQWRDEVRADARRVKAQVEARGGPSRRRRLTRLGGSVSGARFDEEGTLWFAASPPNGQSGIFRLTGLPRRTRAPEAVVRVNGAPQVAPLGDGRLAFAHRERTVGRNAFNDVFAYAPGEPLRRITDGRRVHEVASMPGGASVVATRRNGRVAEVVVIDTRTGKERALVTYRDGSQVFEPRAAPDGRHIVYSRLLLGGARDIVEVEVATGRERLLTDAASDDVTPTYTPDGRRVVFASDRSGGIFNLFAVDRETGELWQITDTLGLAQSPEVTPDGRGVVYEDLTLNGADLFVAALDLPPVADNVDEVGRFEDLPRPRTVPPGPRFRPARRYAGEPQLYNPFPTLLPRNWSPLMSPGSNQSTVYGVSLTGADAVDMFSWALEAGYNLDQVRPDVRARVQVQNLLTPVSASVDWRTEDSLIRVGNEGDFALQRETVLRAGADVSVPLLRRFYASQSLAIGYSRQLYLDESHAIAPPDGPAPAYGLPRNIGAVSVTWSYSDVQSFRDSVSSETGQALTLRWRAAHPLTVSDLELYEASFNARAYRPVPGLPQHNVAVFVSGAFAIGPRSRRASYRIGGFGNRNLPSDLVGQVRFGSGYLRGYPDTVDVGDGFALATLEYRFPLWEVERGIESLPLQLVRVTGSAFADVGDAFDERPALDDLKASVGGEVQISLLVGYYGSFLVRAGYARGLNPRGVHQPYLVMGLPF